MSKTAFKLCAMKKIRKLNRMSPAFSDKSMNLVMSLIRIIFCTIRGCDLQVWPTNYKPVKAYAKFLEISCNTLTPETMFLPYGLTDLSPQLPRALDGVY